MVKDKFLRVEQRPKHVVEDLVWSLAVFQKALEFGEFLRARLAAQAAQIEVFYNFLRSLVFLEQLFHHAAILDFIRDGAAIEQVEGLRKVRLVPPTAFRPRLLLLGLPRQPGPRHMAALDGIPRGHHDLRTAVMLPSRREHHAESGWEDREAEGGGIPRPGSAIGQFDVLFGPAA